MHLEAIKNSFVTGEVSPYVLGRTDLAKYHSALEKCSNFVVRYTGGIDRRWGMRYITDALGPSRLIPFILSPTQTYILEFGNGLLRFYTNDGQIQSGGSPYQITTPFNTSTDDLWDIKYVQIASVLYIVHPNHLPMKLIRNTDTNWQLITPGFICPPATQQNQDISGGTISVTVSSGGATANAPVFIAGDVGKKFIAGTGVAVITAVTGVTAIDPNTGATLFTVANWGAPTNPFDTAVYFPTNWFLQGGPAAFFSPGSWNSVNRFWSGSGSAQFGAYLNIRSTASHPTDSSWQTSTGTSLVNVTYQGGFVDCFRLVDTGKFVPFAGGYGKITIVTNSTSVQILVLSVPTIFEQNAYGNALVAPTPSGGWILETSEFTPTNCPRTITLFQDRLWFGSTQNNPQTFWGSNSSDYENFALGQLASDGIRFTLNSGILEPALWMESYQGNIVVGTFKSEYIINGGAGQQVVSAGAPITPTNIDVIRQSMFGASRVQPILVDNDLLFIQRAAQKTYQFAFNPLTSSYSSKDLGVLNEIITTSMFKEMVYQEQPFKIVWFVDTNGNLVGLTYHKEQDVVAWHRHFTGTDGPDSFVSISSIPAQNGILDELWCCVKRLRNGVYVYTIELLDNTLNLDSAVHTIFNNAITSISGLGYLQGRPVKVVADGCVLPTVTMGASGIYTFPPGFSAKNIKVGINYISEALTVRPEPKLTIQGLIKRWSKVWARIYLSLGLNINSQVIPFTTTAVPLDTATPLFTGDVQINGLGYDRDGRIDIQQINPLPSTVLGVFGLLEVSDGV